MRVLSQQECQEQYLATLKLLSGVVLFQYGFILTINYVFVGNPNETHSILGLELSRFAWATAANVGSVALNLYIVRHIRYLSKLVLVYPQLRRKLRFLTWHHSWFLNPFRGWCLRVQPRAYPTALLHLGLLFFGLFPSIHMLDADLTYRTLHGYPFWFTYVTVAVLSMLHLVSICFVGGSLMKHNNILWKGRFFPLDRELRRRGKNRSASSAPGGSPAPECAPMYVPAPRVGDNSPPLTPPLPHAPQARSSHPPPRVVPAGS
ncbi:hypothetical protein BH23GEM7_BH23GEM7_10840 [soil metagenome]